MTSFSREATIPEEPNREARSTSCAAPETILLLLRNSIFTVLTGVHYVSPHQELQAQRLLAEGLLKATKTPCGRRKQVDRPAQVRQARFNVLVLSAPVVLYKGSLPIHKLLSIQSR